MDPAILKEEKEERERQQKIEKEMAEANKRLFLFNQEKEIRFSQLKQTEELWTILQNSLEIFSFNEKTEKEWSEWINPTFIPNIANIPTLHSFVTQWKVQSELNRQKISLFSYVIEFTPNILKVLEILIDFLLNPTNYNFQLWELDELSRIYGDIQRYQSILLDEGSFELLCYISTNIGEFYDPDEGILEFKKEIKSILGIYFWSNIYGRPEFISYKFMIQNGEETFEFSLPEALHSTKGIFRLLKLEYDPYSKNFEHFILKEDKMKKMMKLWKGYSKFQFKKEMNVEFTGKEQELSPKDTSQMNLQENTTKDVSSSLEPSFKDPGIQKKTKIEGRIKTEAELAKEREKAEKSKFLPKLLENQLNLRNFHILGGIYNFGFFQIPKQCKNIGNEEKWALHHLDFSDPKRRCLIPIEFQADFFLPNIPNSINLKKTPEEMEREAKQNEEELQKLIQIQIKVGKSSLWFEPPKIVRWEMDKGRTFWKSEGFYDVRFNEENLCLSFKTESFGIFGLGHPRWSNLPYQSWEMRPIGPKTIILTLNAAIVHIEITIKENFVCLSSLQNISNSSVVENALLNVFMKPAQLIQAMRNRGLDVFPDSDTYAYVDGILLKHNETEAHLYKCMALTASAMNFHWSRWNLLAGREKIVIQMRERIGSTTPGNYHMVLTTPHSVRLIDCTEVSPTYSEDKPEGSTIQFSGDLLHLVGNIVSEDAKEIMDDSTPQFVETVRIILNAVKILSFA